MNTAVEAPAITVTEEGAESAAFVLEIATTVPPEGAAVVSVTVQLVEVFESRLVELQKSDDTSAEPLRLTTAVAELEPNVAVMVALWLLPTVCVVAKKTADVEPGLTVSEEGTESALLELDKTTRVPPAGAAFDRVTVQPAEAFEPKLDGLQESDDTSGGVAGAKRLSVVFLAALLKVAVMVAV